MQGLIYKVYKACKGEHVDEYDKRLVIIMLSLKIQFNKTSFENLLCIRYCPKYARLNGE